MLPMQEQPDEMRNLPAPKSPALHYVLTCHEFAQSIMCWHAEHFDDALRQLSLLKLSNGTLSKADQQELSLVV